MKKQLLTILSAILWTMSMNAQTIFYSESFEDSLGWKLSHQFDDGFEDFALWDSVAKINARTSGLDFTVVGADSNFILAFEDINSGDPGSAASDSTVILTIDSISINGYDSLQIMLAAAANPTNNRYDNALNWFGSNGNGDTVSVWAAIDNGPWMRVMLFCAPDSNATKTSSSNTGPLYHDINQNYIGGEAGEPALTDTLSDFSGAIVGKGRFLHLRVEIRVESGDEEFAMDNIRVSGKPVPPTCFLPSGMNIQQASPTSATLTWMSNTGLSDLQWDTAGFTPGSGRMVNNVTSSYLLSGLVSGKLYDVYYRDSCASIGKSNWVGPISFSLNASPQVTDIWRTTSTNIMVAYSDSMDNTSATSTARYKGISGLSSVVLNGSNDTATLTYSAAFTNGALNILTIDSVMSAGSVQLDTTYTYEFIYNNSKPNIVITEIMYNDLSGPDTLEYLEVHNTGTSVAFVGGLEFSAGIEYVFAAGTGIPAGSYLVIARDAVAHTAVFGNSTVVQWTSGGLSNSGELIMLVNSENDTIDHVNYSDRNGWPGDPDGGGYSLVLCDVNSDNNQAMSWGLEPMKLGSTDYYVSPGAGNTCRPPFVPPVYPISALRTYNAAGNLDSNQVRCAIEGIVVTDNFSTAGASGPDVSFVIVDPMNMSGFTAISFSDTSVINYAPHLGDSVRVYGKVSQFNGLGQFEIDSVMTFKNMVRIPMPFVTDTLGELTESRFIEIRGVQLVDTAQWPGTGVDRTLKIVNMKGDTLDMRIDQHTNVAANWPSAPKGRFTLKGVGGQFDNSSPYFDGYQVFPRFFTDIDTAAPPAPCAPSSNLITSEITSSSVNVAWTPGDGTTWNVGWAKGHTSTHPTDSVMGITTNPYAITGLDSNQHYHIWIQDVCPNGPPSMWEGPTMFMTKGANSIEEGLKNKISLKAYPNPNKTGLVKLNKTVDFVLLNIVGQPVMEMKESNSFSVSDLESGMYIIQSKDGDTVRLIVE